MHPLTHTHVSTSAICVHSTTQQYVTSTYLFPTILTHPPILAPIYTHSPARPTCHTYLFTPPDPPTYPHPSVDIRIPTLYVHSTTQLRHIHLPAPHLATLASQPFPSILTYLLVPTNKHSPARTHLPHPTYPWLPTHPLAIHRGCSLVLPPKIRKGVSLFSCLCFEYGPELTGTVPLSSSWYSFLFL